MKFNLTFVMGKDDDSVMIDVTIEASSLEDAVKRGREYKTHTLLAKGVTWIDGHATLKGVTEQ